MIPVTAIEAANVIVAGCKCDHVDVGVNDATGLIVFLRAPCVATRAQRVAIQISGRRPACVAIVDGLRACLRGVVSVEAYAAPTFTSEYAVPIAKAEQIRKDRKAWRENGSVALAIHYWITRARRRRR